MTAPDAPSSTHDYFSGLQHLYAQFRPSYPQRAIGALLDGLPDAPHIASIGCGTGIDCRLMAQRGAQMTGIDPNEAMLEQARAETADAGLEIEYRVAIAEDTGFADGSLDLVVCAQSFHWFDSDRALPEFHRILKSAPAGRLVLMWNVRDLDDPVGAGYEALVREAQADARSRGMVTDPARSGDPTTTGHFRHERSLSVPNPQQLTEDQLIGRLSSASYSPTSGPVHERLVDGLRELFHNHCQDELVVLGQSTCLTIASRIDSPCC